MLIGAAALLASPSAPPGWRATPASAKFICRASKPIRCSTCFLDDPDGGVSIVDASSGKVLDRAKPGTNGFLRGALRGFAQERLRAGLGRSEPFTLTRWRDGTLSLQDRATDRRIDLDAFGPTQAQSFAHLFADKEDAR